MHIFAKEKIFEQLPLSNTRVIPFFQRIQSLYKDITYHNKTHAADLCQSFYSMCRAGLAEKCNLDKWDMLAYITAGACHDVEHPGFNNVYLTEVGDQLAIRYNDQSVLESHHVAKSFEVLKDSEYNFTMTF